MAWAYYYLAILNIYLNEFILIFKRWNKCSYNKTLIKFKFLSFLILITYKNMFFLICVFFNAESKFEFFFRLPELASNFWVIILKLGW